MPVKNITFIPHCLACFGNARMFVEVLHHKGENRDHFRIVCKCGNSTKPWLMPHTALKRWIGAK